MRDRGDRVIYVGQSGNLRQRLGSYKNARLDRAPRKTIRLVHAVHSLTWEVCASPAAARLREAQLLRVHRPPFNIVNPYPPACRFISVGGEDPECVLQLGPEPVAGAAAYGAFKSGAGRAFGGLLRLLWTAAEPGRDWTSLPARLLAARPPAEFRFAPPAGRPARAWREALQGFFGGTARELLDWLEPAPAVNLFQQRFQEADLELLRSFYQFGPRRLARLRREHAWTAEVVPPETLLDWLAEAGPLAEPPSETEGATFSPTLTPPAASPTP